jgi:hypothetical protein
MVSHFLPQMNIIFPEKQTTIDNSMAKGFVEAAVF